MEKIILITGSTDGIGKAVAMECAQKGANVIIHGRNVAKAKKTVSEIMQLTNNKNIYYTVADFSDLSQVTKMASDIKNRFPKVDVLINNACTFEHTYKATKNNFETTFQICYLAHFLLTIKLLDWIKKSDDARIVNVSSMVHAHSFSYEYLNDRKHYDGYRAYEVSKLANVLFTYELAEQLKDVATVNCLHPGVISTKLLHKGWGLGGSSTKSGAKTPVYLALSDEVKNITGKYFVDKTPTRSSAITYDKKVRKEFWNYTKNLLEEKELL